MPKVRLSLPVDSTFLSSVIYEGLLYLIPEHSKTFSLRDIDFENDFLAKAFSQLGDDKIANIRIVMAGNDNINAKIFEKIGLALQSKKTFYDLLKMLKDNSNAIKLTKNIDIELKINKKDNLIDLNKKGDGISAPQIFKIDRYTGFSSLETPYTSQQLTLYTSTEVALIALLGIYSAFVVSTRQQQQNNYYFLFFSPDEVLKLLANGNKDLIKAYLQVKDKAREMLSEIIARHYSNELLIAEVALNLEIRDLLKKENLDKVSLLLFKISPEGQTYKIYEVVTLDFFNETKFDVVSRHFRDQERLIETLTGIVSPKGVILEALASMNRKNRYAEAENILVAIQGLYRFVVLGDAQGFQEFMQKLSEAVRKLENSDDGRERRRAEEYRRFISKLSSA
ncbi:MAG: hypothetical protein QFX36_06865 [Archaeoglobales archaeon]|nr:hypothetical protein [Archaeoglobales archaeon]